MTSKIMSLAEAVATIPNGATVALGGNTIHRNPSAAVHEIIRQGKRDLTIVKTAGGYDVDILCGTGVAKAVIAGYIGYENVLGIAPMYRNSVEQGLVHAYEHACYSVIAGLRAAAQGVPFMPIAGMFGSDLLETQGFLTVTDPYTGQKVVAVKAIVPDVTIIHVHESDEMGNGHIVGSLFDDVLMASAAHHVILTAETIVNPLHSRESPIITTIASFMVDAVVHVPRGAWPCSCAGSYEYDEFFLANYYAATYETELFQLFLENHILNPTPTERQQQSII